MTRPEPEAIKDRRHKRKQGGIAVLYFLNTESIYKKFAKALFLFVSCICQIKGKQILEAETNVIIF